jgi:hypothetical protein
MMWHHFFIESLVVLTVENTPSSLRNQPKKLGVQNTPLTYHAFKLKIRPKVEDWSLKLGGVVFLSDDRRDLT